ncbi:MAG: hypothetical protein DRP02_12320, partial [Candidatus Gerdarchaeota archaeon]
MTEEVNIVRDALILIALKESPKKAPEIIKFLKDKTVLPMAVSTVYGRLYQLERRNYVSMKTSRKWHIT